MELPIIGLTGRAGAGKDTVCKLLMEYNPGFHRFAFTDALRHEVYEALRLSHGEKYLPDALRSWEGFEAYVAERKRYDPDTQEGAIRQLLQAWGMIRRDLEGDEYWLNRAVLDSGTVITDLRFPNEAELVRSRDGWVVNVWRDGIAPMRHISERGEMMADYTIYNNGTIEDLKREIAWFVEHLSAFKLGAY
jgi:hypothetical protein